MNTPTLGGWLVHVMREVDGSLSFEEALHVIMDSMKEYFPAQSEVRSDFYKQKTLSD